MAKKKTFSLFQDAVGLLVVAAGVILVLMQINMSRTLKDLSLSLVEQTREQSESELNQFFHSVEDELLRLKGMGHAGMFDQMETEALNPLFVPLMAYSAKISSIQVANNKGEEYMLMHFSKDDRWISRVITPGEGRTWTYWKDLQTDTPIVDSIVTDQKKAEPQGKDWFLGAIRSASEGKIYWSKPYHFKTADRTGMTLSVRYESLKAPGTDYVIVLDLLLEDISRFTQKARITPNARSFVITREGELVGLPRDTSVEEDNLEAYLLRPIQWLEIPSLSMAVARWEEGEKKETFRFESEGENWWAGFRPVALSDEMVLYAGVVIPESDLLSNVRRTRQVTYLGWGLIGLLVLVMGMSYVRQRRSRHLLEAQEQIIEKEKEKSRLEQEKARIETERAERLSQVDKLKDEFLANTSHELRTPLNGIIGIAESLYDGVETYPAKDLRSNLSMIVSSGRRLTSLVNDLLDFSKLKTHNLSLRAKPTDLRALTGVVLRISETLVGGKPLTLENLVPEDLPAVEADEDRLQQIMYNLIGNGIKFTEKGTVSVSAWVEGARVKVAVSDTGMGIPKEKQETIFNSFEQVEGDATRKYGGTGLGLTISRRLVELHGGKLTLSSRPGEGSVFTFDLPVSDQPAEESHRKEVLSSVVDAELVMPVEAQQGREETIRILVVDDEPINLQVLVNHLSPYNYALNVALNGEEALDLLGKEKYDLVLLDVMMPGMSGYEVCQQIRKRFLPNELPVIMITAKNQVADLVEGLSFGANDYLAKPFSKSEFLARVKTHLNLLNINSAYGKFVPHQFLKALGHESILDVNLGDQTEQTISVLFADIRSYTSLSEQMTPSENFNFINAYLGRMAPIIKENQGMINHFLGDGIMAIFPRNATHAVLGAVEMQKELLRYNTDRSVKGRLPIRVGMGIHTGKLMMGIIGDRERMDTALISDTVNTASRFEGLTKFYGANILVSDDTLKMIEDPTAFHYRFLGKVQVKGKQQVIGVYEILDGDPPDLIERKQRTRDRFEAGMYAFFAKDFAGAAQAFTEVLAIDPKDMVASMYLERARQYTREGVGEEWTGVETMVSK